MSIKDELQHVKDELTGDEKILEGAFKLERLYKKNKVTIWALGLLVVVGFLGKTAWNAYQQYQLDTANAALLTLQGDPKNRDALASLKSHNPKLYRLYALSQALQNNAPDALKGLASSPDPLVADIARYHAGVLAGKAVDTRYYHDLSVIEAAWADLKAGKRAEAKSRLALIAENSPVAKIAQLLQHDTIELK